ncbi:MAG: hypothetical protein QOK28_1466 [Actinomycetota bacterium]|jgi:uncharacterized protein (TIGR03083 family)
MTKSLGPDDLIAVADDCVDALTPLIDRDWDTPAAGLEWSCRQTLEHLGALSYAPILALRAPSLPKFGFSVFPDLPVDWLLPTARTNAAVVAEVARAAPLDARAWHPAGMADPSGFIAMMADELVVHTHDIATALGDDYRPDSAVTRALLDRLFPWWPQDAEPWDALLWAHGRTDLPGHPSPGADWLWHCAPVDEWDGTIPQWDPVSQSKRTR